jgi:hypothetical protein
MTVRWTFTDTETDETITVPVNPNKMSSPTAARTLKWSHAPDGVLRGIDTGAERPVSWTFSGVIFTKSHYDLLLTWAQRDTVLEISDHLGRTFEVIIEQYDPVERRPTGTKPWRATYTISCLLLREI